MGWAHYRLLLYRHFWCALYISTHLQMISPGCNLSCTRAGLSLRQVFFERWSSSRGIFGLWPCLLVPRLKQFVAPDEENFLWWQNNGYWRLETVVLGFHWVMTKCFIWASIGIMINYLVKPIKQKNQTTNPNRREPAPGHHISFSCHFQGEIPPEKKTFESLYISQIISCGESEASISQIQIINQSTRDYRDKHVLNQIIGNPGSPSMVTS